MTNDDLLFRHRKLLFRRAGEVRVRRACAELGYHHSTYYYWRRLWSGGSPLEPRHLEAELPGELVQVDCFYIGRLTGTRAAPGSTPPSTWPAPSFWDRSTSVTSIPGLGTPRSSWIEWRENWRRLAGS